MKTAIELIAEERARQISEEGWTLEHDDQHTTFELADAGACYAVCAADSERYFAFASDFWPWEFESWKPDEDPIRNLVKAGALIAAEIERLQRLETVLEKK